MFCDVSDDVYKDENGKILTSGDIILCKGCPVIVMADDSIDHHTMGKMDRIYYTADEELGALEGRVDEFTSGKKSRVGNKVMADSLR